MKEIANLRNQDEAIVENAILQNTQEVLWKRWGTVLKFIPEAQVTTGLK